MDKIEKRSIWIGNAAERPGLEKSIRIDFQRQVPRYSGADDLAGDALCGIIPVAVTGHIQIRVRDAVEESCVQCGKKLVPVAQQIILRQPV